MESNENDNNSIESNEIQLEVTEESQQQQTEEDDERAEDLETSGENNGEDF